MARQRPPRQQPRHLKPRESDTAYWVRTKSDEEAVRLGCWFDLAAAELVRDFVRTFCRHTKGVFAGKPFDPLDWQWRDIIAPIFGWKRADGTRRFRRSYSQVPKKNGKSTLWAALDLHLLVGDGEQGAEVYLAAVDRTQGSIVYFEAAAMARGSPPLAELLQIIDSTKTIVFPHTNSRLRVLSADAKQKEGLNASAITSDELHAWKDRKLYDALKYAGAARSQPLQATITTAGDDLTSLCYEEYLHAKGILDGTIIDPYFHAAIWEAAPGDDFRDPAVWRKANPSLGQTLQESEFAEEVARLHTPSQVATFRRYRLNVWGQTEQKLFAMDHWDACGQVVDPFAWRPGGELPPRLKALVGRPCFGGLDLANSLDFVAFALVWPPLVAGGVVETAVLFWCPEEKAEERRQQGRTPFDNWIRLGWIETTAGATTDHSLIRQRLNQVRAAGMNLGLTAFDPTNCQQLADELVWDGFEMRRFEQSVGNYNEPTNLLITLLAERRLIYGGNPVQRWMAGNTVGVRNGAEQVKPSRKKSAEKIDGIVAKCMALGAWIADGGQAVADRPLQGSGLESVDLSGDDE